MHTIASTPCACLPSGCSANSASFHPPPRTMIHAASIMPRQPREPGEPCTFLVKVASPRGAHGEGYHSVALTGRVTPFHRFAILLHPELQGLKHVISSQLWHCQTSHSIQYRLTIQHACESSVLLNIHVARDELFSRLSPSISLSSHLPCSNNDAEHCNNKSTPKSKLLHCTY